MTTNMLNTAVQNQSSSSTIATITARLSAITAILTIVLLISLHALSPEFNPSWRMVSEYALGNYSWVLSIMFTAWAVSSWALFFAIRSQVKTNAGKVGLIFLILAGIGMGMAAIFDVRQETLHGVAAMIGIPSLPIAAMLISYSLKRNPDWQSSKKKIVLTANFTWISLLLMTITVMMLISGFEKAGIKNPNEVTTMPVGVIAIAGWANRLLIVAYCFWTITMAKAALRLSK
jgi:hypothetical protein